MNRELHTVKRGDIKSRVSDTKMAGRGPVEVGTASNALNVSRRKIRAACEP